MMSAWPDTTCGLASTVGWDDHGKVNPLHAERERIRPAITVPRSTDRTNDGFPSMKFTALDPLSPEFILASMLHILSTTASQIPIYGKFSRNSQPAIPGGESRREVAFPRQSCHRRYPAMPARKVESRGRVAAGKAKRPFQELYAENKNDGQAYPAWPSSAFGKTFETPRCS